MEDIAGVVNGEPVPNEGPPTIAVYQLSVPADAVAANETVPVPQREFGLEAVTDGAAFTVSVAAVVVCGEFAAQVLVTTQRYCFPLSPAEFDSISVGEFTPL